MGGLLQNHYEGFDPIAPGEYLAWFGNRELRAHPMTVITNAVFWAKGPDARTALAALRDVCPDYNPDHRYGHGLA